MRDQANMTGDSPKWIILDGDIDPMWIESLNTLMDDNKVSTGSADPPDSQVLLSPPTELEWRLCYWAYLSVCCFVGILLHGIPPNLTQKLSILSQET